MHFDLLIISHWDQAFYSQAGPPRCQGPYLLSDVLEADLILAVVPGMTGGPWIKPVRRTGFF